MCKHINTDPIISLINQMNAHQLHHLQQAIDHRRQQLADRPLSTVVERRNYQNGVLQLERRAYRHKKDGKPYRRQFTKHFRFGFRALLLGDGTRRVALAKT
jgi:hypothetical protein